ncbi:MAG: hypothetical protein ACXVX6_06575 [Mycobacterium sp.]
MTVPAGLPPASPAPADIALGGQTVAGNSDVAGDNAGSTQMDMDRRAHAADAAAKFPANEADATQQFQSVGAQGSTQMMQQLVSSITGALGGAIGGILGPLTQLPQQAMQAGQGAMQPLMSALQGAHGAGAAEAAEGSRLVGSLGGEPGAGLGGGGGGGLGSGGLGGGGTTPAGYMGPPPVPSTSPPTTPAGAPAKPVMMSPTGGTLPMSGQAGMTGMPMMPPGAMGGHGEGGNKEKPPEKRVTAPGVTNGQPVKGRLTIPPSAPAAAKPGDGKPAVVTNRPTRRIVIMPNDDEAKE